MSPTFITLSALTAAVFLIAGAQKVLLTPMMAGPMRRLGVADGLTRLIGLLELAGAGGLVAGIWFEPLGVAAVTGLAALLIGAVGYHLRAGDYRDRQYRGSALAPIVLLTMVAATATLLIT